MKTCYLITILLCVSISNVTSKPNPLMPPTFMRISELYFDQSNKWFIEIDYSYYDNIDSFYIASSTGKSKTKKLLFDSYQKGLKVFSVDSLINGLNINPLGDSITIKWYSKYKEPNFDTIDYLVYGNYRNAVISKPNTGQSIIKIFREIGYLNYSDPVYCKNNSPSLGTANTQDKIYGTLKGKLYNHLNNPVINSTFSLENAYNSSDVVPKFQTDAEGNFSINILASRYSLDSLFFYFSPENPSTIQYCILKNKLNFDLEPDSTLSSNIYLTDIYIGIKDIQPGYDHKIKIYPNPLISGDRVHYEIDMPINKSDIIVNLIDINGKIIDLGKIESTKGSIELKGICSPGLYLLSFMRDNKCIQSFKLIIKK